MKNSIFGISFDGKLTNVYDKFNEVFFESDNSFFESKQTFTLKEEDGLTFNYKYVIEGVWCDDKIFYTLALVPCANSLDNGMRSKVASCSGVEEDEITTYDIFSYGCNVSFGTKVVDSNYTNIMIFDMISSVVDVIDSLRGFYLDKPTNRLGTTGWELLDYFINGIDYVNKAV